MSSTGQWKLKEGEGLSLSKSISGASLIAQTVKNLPELQETQVLCLGREDPLEKEVAIHSCILAWRIPRTGAWWAAVHGVARSRTRLPFTFKSISVAGRDEFRGTNALALGKSIPNFWEDFFSRKSTVSRRSPAFSPAVPLPQIPLP